MQIAHGVDDGSFVRDEANHTITFSYYYYYMEQPYRPLGAFQSASDAGIQAAASLRSDGVRLVTGRIRIVAAWRAIVRSSGRRARRSGSCICSAPVVGASPSRPASRSCKRQWRERSADDVDEDRGRPIGFRKATLEHIDIEYQLVAFEFR